MDVDLEDENDMSLQMINSILELWQTKNIESIITNDFNELRVKIKQQMSHFIDLIHKLEALYINHVQLLENEHKTKYANLKTEIEKLNNLKQEIQKNNEQYFNNNNKRNKTNMKHEVDVKCIENLSDKIRIMSQNKIDYIPNKKFTLESLNIGKLANLGNKYEDKRLNLLNKTINNEFLSNQIALNNINCETDASNNELVLLNNQDYLTTRKVDLSNYYSKPLNICRSNNRFTGALIIPEYKYIKLLNIKQTQQSASLSSTSTSSINTTFSQEFALFSVANRNILKLISIPEGRTLRTYERFQTTDSKEIQTLKEPRGMCWNYNKSLIIVCDAGNNRLAVLKPIFKKIQPATGSSATAYLTASLQKQYFQLDIEFVFEVSDLTSLNYNQANNYSIKSQLIDTNKLQYPASLCCNHEINGEIYICDTFNNRIVCLNKELNLIDNIILGGFNNPFGICIWKQKLIIADTYNNRIILMSIVDGEREKMIPSSKKKYKNLNENNDDDDIAIDDEDSDDDDEDDDDDDSENDNSLNNRRAKRKRLTSSSSSSSSSANVYSTSNDDSLASSMCSSSSSSSDDDDDDDDDDEMNLRRKKSKKKKQKGQKKHKLKHGRFKRPYGVCIDANDRLFVLDWYKTDTKSTEETMKLSGRIQSFDLLNDLQLINYTKAYNQLHLPNTMMLLKNGTFLVCNIKHLTLFSKFDYDRSKLLKRHRKIKWRNVNNYSDDDDVIILSHK